MPIVTALKPDRRGRVAVEVDGAPWRIVPTEVAASVGLAAGRELDRSALRDLRRALRRSEALASATRALRHRELSSRRVDERLEAAAIPPAARAEALEALGRAGFVDDGRFAERRAGALAERGFGNEGIRHDLERQGIDPDLREHVIAGLPDERERVALIVARRGPGPKTARYVAGKGFGAEAVEAALAGSVAADT